MQSERSTSIGGAGAQGGGRCGGRFREVTAARSQRYCQAEGHEGTSRTPCGEADVLRPEQDSHVQEAQARGAGERGPGCAGEAEEEPASRDSLRVQKMEMTGRMEKAGQTPQQGPGRWGGGDLEENLVAPSGMRSQAR